MYTIRVSLGNMFTCIVHSVYCSAEMFVCPIVAAKTTVRKFSPRTL